MGKIGAVWPVLPVLGKIRPKGEEQDCFFRETQFLSSGPQAKGYSTPVLGLYGAALEFWNDILKVPSRRRRDENGGSPFGDMEWFWHNLFKNSTKKN